MGHLHNNIPTSWSADLAGQNFGWYKTGQKGPSLEIESHSPGRIARTPPVQATLVLLIYSFQIMSAFHAAPAR